MSISDRDFGNLEARMANVERTLGDLKSEVKDGNAVSDKILLKLSAAEGGWRTLAAVAAASAAVGGVLAKFLPIAAILPK